MKTIILFVSVIFFFSTSYAENQDSIFVTISADTVHIWNTGAHENCACLFYMNILTSNDTIYVTEIDTADQYAFCMCYFDLCATVTGLQSGNYFVEIYRQLSRFPDTLFYIGSTSFTFGGSSLAFVTQSYQSDCYYLLGVQPDDVLPQEFILEQNYPNPFNPVTTIKYTIPTSPFNPSPYQGEGQRERLVTLIVYDILGSEVATLVNQEQNAGSYRVDFNASHLASGIYFYQLKAGSFVSTKKMVLIK